MSYAVGILVLAGALLTFGGALGLVRLKTFYERVHPPTMATTLGTVLIVTAFILHFGTMDALLIGVFMTLTTPVTLVLLVGAARRRRRS
jgi:multicomponent K+:H+ antiporter subunit G